MSREIIKDMYIHVSIVSPRKWIAAAGAGCILAAIVGGSLQLGNIELPAIAAPSRQIAIATVGVVLLVASVVSLSATNQIPGGNVLLDPTFWSKVYEAMPPSFIKEYPVNAHLADNQALRTFQGHKPNNLPSDTDLHVLINKDHQTGDAVAAQNGTSVQLELTDQCPTRHPHLILTFKTRIEHGGKVYIVGWYVPIESSGSLVGRETIRANKRGEQIVFQSPKDIPSGRDALLVKVGRSPRHANASRTGGRPWRR